MKPILVFVLGLAPVLGVGTAHAQGMPTVTEVQNPTDGATLTSPSGQTLYRWAGDQPGVSACSGQCAAIWVPLLVDGDVVAPDGLPGTLGVIMRDDGTRQVTYNNWPIYTFSGDAAPGSMSGQGLTGFGAVWSVVGATASGHVAAAMPQTTSQTSVAPADGGGLQATPANPSAATPAYSASQSTSPPGGLAGYGSSAATAGSFGSANGAYGPYGGSPYPMMGGYGSPSGYPGSSGGYGYPMMGPMGYGSSMSGYGGSGMGGLGYPGSTGGYGFSHGAPMMMHR